MKLSVRSELIRPMWHFGAFVQFMVGEGWALSTLPKGPGPRCLCFPVWQSGPGGLKTDKRLYALGCALPGPGSWPGGRRKGQSQTGPKILHPGTHASISGVLVLRGRGQFQTSPKIWRPGVCVSPSGGGKGRIKRALRSCVQVQKIPGLAERDKWEEGIVVSNQPKVWAPRCSQYLVPFISDFDLLYKCVLVSFTCSCG